MFLNNVFANEVRLALIVGNSNYTFVSPLRNPVNDANAISNVLIQAGFKVLLHNDLNQKQFKKAIRAFGEQLTSADVALFFYAGHAVQVNGRNYLIPIDAQIQLESDIEIEGIDVASVLSKMGGSLTSLNLVILDSCRDNPFLTNNRTINNGLAFTVAPSGTLIAFSTAPGKYASDGAGKNGLYTSYLIDYMKIPGLKIEDVFKQVRKAVRHETEGKQIPWESSSLEGDFYFFNNKETSLMVTPVNKTKTLSINKLGENTDYNIIKNIQLETTQKLALCDEYFYNNTFYDGSSHNALTCYKSILRKDKENDRAIGGVKQIISIYETNFKQELNANKLQSAESLLTILRKISPNSNFIINAKRLLDNKLSSTSIMEEEEEEEEKNNFICSDLREKEIFAGSMGFSELTAKEKQLLYFQCP